MKKTNNRNSKNSKTMTSSLKKNTPARNRKPVTFNPKTKVGSVLSFMQKGRAITAAQAESMFGTTRLSDIVYKLRQSGYKVVLGETTRKGSNSTFAKYSLA